MNWKTKPKDYPKINNMAENSSTNIDISKIAVVLAAHGSPASTGVETPTIRLQKNLSQADIFSTVSCGFLEQEPKISDVLKNVTESEVYVVPVMACKGYIANTKLPRALNLTGDLTERLSSGGRQRIHLTDPLGTNDDLPIFASRMLCEAMEKANISPNDASVIIVGHGSMQSRASFEQTNTIAKTMNNAEPKLNVKSAYLEEPPRIGDWEKISSAKHIFVLPIMISDGHHGRRDIPNEIGIKTDTMFDESLSSGIAGPYEINGKFVYMLAPLGESEQMAELVISTVKQEIKKGR
ncbi:MAG: hypothetical protein OEX17_05375 [Rhodospirillaceae bacterium]|nr:hypothetical protein [Rhodospirillaceae bacterium]